MKLFPSSLWLRVLCSIASIIMLMLAGAVLWLSSAPRALPMLQDVTQRTLAEKLAAKRVTVQPPLLHLNLSHRRIEITLQQLTAEFAAGKAEAQTVRVAMPIGALLRGRNVYAGVQLEGMQLFLPTQEAPLAIPSLRIDPDATNEQRTHFTIDLSAITQGAAIQGSTENTNEATEVRAVFERVPASLVSLMLPDAAGLNAQLTGEVTLHLPHTTPNRRLTFNLFADTLTYTHPLWYPNPEKPLRFDSIALAGNWDARTHLLTLEGLNMVLDTMNMGFRGTIHDTLTQANITADIRQLPVDKVYSFWPRGISDEARTWVVKRLEDGRITEGRADISLNKTTENTWLDAVKVESTLALDGVRVVYMDALPQVKDVHGTVTITANSLDIALDGGNVLANTTLIKGSYIRIPSFSDAAIPIFIHLDIAGTARDVATYILPQYLNKATALKLKPETIQGTVEGRVVLNLPLYPERAGLGKSSYDNLQLAIRGTLTNIAQKGIMGKWNAEDFDGLIRLDNKRVALEAKGTLQGAPATLDIAHFYDPTQPIRTEYHVTLALLDAQFAAFDIPLPPERVQGKIVLSADIIEKDGIATTNATLNMTEALLALPEIDWNKPIGQKADVKVVQTTREGIAQIDSLIFDTKDAKAQGSITFDAEGNAMKADFPVVRAPNLSFAVGYAQRGAHQTIRIQGEKLNLKTTRKEQAAKAAAPRNVTNPFTTLLNRSVDVDIARVSTDQTLFEGVKFRSECGADYCASLNASARFDKGKDVFSAAITHANGKRQLQVDSSDMGTLLSALGLMQDMKAGVVRFAGAYDDSQPSRPLKGRFTSENIVFTQVPILTKLLTLASLRGIADTISGKGIAFDTISSDVTYADETFTLRNAKVKGDAMGVLLEGTVAPYGAGKINVKGTLAPSTMINTLPGKVPLIGQLLVGGEDEGVFGAKFAVRGTLEKPDIIVNPLSILTPGFLRNIFDIFPDSDGQSKGDTAPADAPSQRPQSYQR
jgi:Protein of unknown function/AsmA-like C-terminal region